MLGVLAGACVTLTAPCARLLIGFMLPVTFYVHGYWRYTAAARQHHLAGMFQNLTMSGGLVLLLATGPGVYSIDALLASRLAG